MTRIPTDKNIFFKGRPGDPRLGEWTIAWEPAKATDSSFVIWGCPDDTGVLLNHGRAGAALGPDSIRTHLYRMTPPMDEIGEVRLLDAGNLVPGKDICETQNICQRVVTELSSSGNFIALGGGHDFAAPNFLGFIEGRRRNYPNAKFGLLNVDPHLDVRELENNLPHSGTPFRQILESGFPGSSFVAFGIRRNRNSRKHFQYCVDKNVQIRTFEDLRRTGRTLNEFKKSIDALSRRNDFLGLTIDMDSCSDAEGSSAAPVVGFGARELVDFGEMAGSNPKIQFLEIAEVAPKLDFNERSSRIAAEIIYAFIFSRATLNSSKKSRKIRKR